MENTAERFVVEVTLYASELGVAIAQPSCDTGDSNGRQALRDLLSTMDLDCVLIQTDDLHTTKAFFQLVSEQGADVLMAVKGNQPKLNGQIKDQFRFRRQFPVEISQSESVHGRAVTWTPRAMEATDVIRESWPETSWILELRSTGSRDGKPFDHHHYFLTTMRTSPEALLRLVRQRWSIENSWYWVRDVLLGDEDYLYN